MKSIKRKACSILLVSTVILMGIACGGGGSSAVILPVLPEGTLYLYEEGMSSNFDHGDYVEVTEELDNSFETLPANPAESIWAHGLFFWMNFYGEDGFILAIEPDDPEQDIARISVAVHPRGLNFTPETLAFMEEDVDNLFIIMNIMAGLEGEGAIGSFFRGTLQSDVYITAGGSYKSEMKEGAQEMVDGYYASIPFPLNLFITKQQFQAYLSQQIYNSTYEGGERVNLTEFLSIFLEPWNWNRTDFKITMELISAISGLMQDISAAEGASDTYDQRNTGNLELGARIYRGSGAASSFRITAFPEEIGGRGILRTRVADAGWTGEEFLTFDLLRPATLYMAVDPVNQVLIDLLVNGGWTLWEGKTVTARMSYSPYTSVIFNLYYKDCGKGEMFLPGNGDENTQMYFAIADAGTYPFGMDIIATAHADLMQDDPADVPSLLPAVKEEGGIVVNENGITEDPQTGLPLVHADFVREFDANVLVDTEKGGAQTAIAGVTDIQFIEHVLKNNGFRLIDTYNDMYPAFGGDSQVLLVENMLGFNFGQPIRVPLLKENLFSFANMNLLNSPNLIGVYIKAVRTDDENLIIWKNETEDRGLDVWNIIDYLELHALSYRYFILQTGEEISLPALLNRIGLNSEGEMTFSAIVELPDSKVFELVGGAFIHDYFTNVYDAVIGDAAPLNTSTGEDK